MNGENRAEVQMQVMQAEWAEYLYVFYLFYFCYICINSSYLFLVLYRRDV